MSAVIVEARPCDMIALRQIVSDIYGRRSAEEFNLPPDAILLVAHDAGAVVGCAGYVPEWTLWGAYTISWVRVAPCRQNAGIGRKLVGTCLEQISAVGSLVLLGTTIPKYYERHWGFVTLLQVTTPEYDDEQHHLMLLRLNEVCKP